MPYAAAYGTRLGLSEHIGDMDGIRKAKHRSKSFPRRMRPMQAGQPVRHGSRDRARSALLSHGNRVSPANIREFRGEDFSFDPKISTRPESARVSHPNGPLSDGSLSPTRLPRWLAATCRTLSDNHPLRKIAPPSPPDSNQSFGRRRYSPAPSVPFFYPEGRSGSMDQPFSNMYHAPSVPLQSEGRIDPHNSWLQSADRIANHGAPESGPSVAITSTSRARSSRSYGATNPTGVASDARYSSPVLGRSLNHAPQFVSPHTPLPPSPVISSTVTLMHPLARRLPSFPAFAQPLPVATPVFQKSKEIPMSRPMRWTVNQRRYTHFPSDPVSEAVRTTHSFITPSIGASIPFHADNSSFLSLGARLNVNNVSMGSQRPTEFLGHAMPTSPIWSRFPGASPRTPQPHFSKLEKRFVKESAANTSAENRISPSLLPTPRKSSDHKDVYNEKLVNFVANSYRYSPLPSLMVGIERGMRGRIASSQQTIPNESEHTRNHSPNFPQGDTNFTASHSPYRLTSDPADTFSDDQRFLASTYSGRQPFTPVGLKAQSSLTNEILRPSDVELPTALPNPTQPRRGRDHSAAQSIHHPLPITELSPPRLRVREIAVEDPINVKPCIPLPESERTVQTGSFSARNSSARSPILHNLKTPTKGQVSGGTNCRNVPPSTEAQKDAQGSQASNDTIGSWSLDDDVLSYLKQK